MRGLTRGLVFQTWKPQSAWPCVHGGPGSYKHLSGQDRREGGQVMLQMSKWGGRYCYGIFGKYGRIPGGYLELYGKRSLAKP